LSAPRHALAGVELFAGLSEAEREGLAQLMRPRRLALREQLFHKGDEGSEVYLVTRGALKALTTSEDGDDVVFSILGPGELIGEIAFLTRSRRTATVAAVEASEVLALDRRDFLAFLRSHPDASLELMAVLAARLKRVSELVEDTLFLNLPVRFAKKLVHYTAIYGEPTADGDLVGATRESINKQMRAWTEEGLISLHQGYVLIHRPEDLEQLAGCALE
jgi:CRP/FNR family cyclic AMP-dependent transcriptional regulator